MATYPNTPNNKPIFNEFMTPVGKITRLYHDAPRIKTNYETKQPILDKDGVPEAEYIVSIVWPKSMLDMEAHPTIPGSPGLLPLRRTAYQTQCEAWPETLDPARAAWVVLEPFLMDGDNPQHNTDRKEFLFGHVWMNIKSKAKYTRDPQGRIVYEGAPGLIGPYGENGPPLHHSGIWPGCEARASGVMFGTEFAGKKHIKKMLNNIQLYREGERMFGSTRPDAAKQFDPLMQGQPPIAGMVAGPMGGGMGAPAAFGAPAGLQGLWRSAAAGYRPFWGCPRLPACQSADGCRGLFCPAPF
jgi:hypothetical protein